MMPLQYLLIQIPLYITTESFNIVLDSSLRLASNRIQNILTHVDAEVIKTEDNESGRLQYQDIINFIKIMFLFKMNHHNQIRF